MNFQLKNILSPFLLSFHSPILFAFSFLFCCHQSMSTHLLCNWSCLSALSSDENCVLNVSSSTSTHCPDTIHCDWRVAGEIRGISETVEIWCVFKSCSSSKLSSVFSFYLISRWFCPPSSLFFVRLTCTVWVAPSMVLEGSTDIPGFQIYCWNFPNRSHLSFPCSKVK